MQRCRLYYLILVLILIKGKVHLQWTFNIEGGFFFHTGIYSISFSTEKIKECLLELRAGNQG